MLEVCISHTPTFIIEPSFSGNRLKPVTQEKKHWNG